MVTHAGDSSGHGTLLGTTGTVAYDSAGSTLLVAACGLYMSGDNPVTLTGITDDAGNTWTLPAAAQGGSYDSAAGFYGYAAGAFCNDAAAVTLVTFHFSASVTDSFYAQVSEFSGMPAGATTDGAAGDSTGSGGSDITSFTTPAVTTAGPADVVIAAAAVENGFSAANSPWTYIDASGMAWLITSSAGSEAATFTGTSQRVTGSMTLAIGVPAGASPSALLMASFP